MPSPSKTKVYIRNSGVYKFEQRQGEMNRKSAAGVYDFNPSDFYQSRKEK
jgi:hypothetical protein